MTTMSTAKPTQTVPVLMYHSISDSSTEAFRPFVVSPRRFAEHLAWLEDNGYRSLSVSELSLLRREGRTPSERCVVLTFDDAFRDFVIEALPLLMRHRMQATLYVPTGFVGGTSSWLVAEGEQRRTLVSWDDLAQLSEVGVECGAHSHSHPQLDLLDRRAAAREIALCRSLLEDGLQRTINSFAYPFGYSNAAVRELVAQQGFDHAFSVGDLPSTDADDDYAIPRLTVTAGTTTNDLADLLRQPRSPRIDAQARLRAVASRALRTARFKKSANAPGRAPVPRTAP